MAAGNRSVSKQDGTKPRSWVAPFDVEGRDRPRAALMSVRNAWLRPTIEKWSMQKVAIIIKKNPDANRTFKMADAVLLSATFHNTHESPKGY